jgi:hypothetical protein
MLAIAAQSIDKVYLYSVTYFVTLAILFVCTRDNIINNIVLRNYHSASLYTTVENQTKSHTILRPRLVPISKVT